MNSSVEILVPSFYTNLFDNIHLVRHFWDQVPALVLSFLIQWGKQLGPSHKVFRHFVCFVSYVSMLSTFIRNTNVLVQHLFDQGSLCIFIMIWMTLHCAPSVWRCYDIVLILVTIAFFELRPPCCRKQCWNYMNTPL